MEHFAMADYALMLLAVLVHAPFGKRLGISHPVTQSLVGLSLTGLLVACLANVAAGLIRPVILGAIALGTAFTVHDLLRLFRSGYRPDRSAWAGWGVLAALGIALFLLNDPAKVFISHGPQGEILFSHNHHYPYYSSLSVEMLNADYLSRLKIMTAFPHTWTSFHFFNASTQAVAQGLIAEPGILTYFMAQTLLMILVFLSLGERVFATFGLTLRTAALLAAWLVLGFTLFGYVLSWNLASTGLFSVFAMGHLLYSLLLRIPGPAMVFAFVLGASAFRLMPVALVAMVNLFLLHFRKVPLAANLASLKALNPFHYAGILLFGLYNVLTVIPEQTPDAAVPDAFHRGWMHTLSSYQLLGYVLGPVLPKNPFSDFHDRAHIFRVPHQSPWAWLLILVLAALGAAACAFLVRAWVKRRPLGRGWNLLDGAVLLFAAALALLAARTPVKSAALFITCLPYGLFLSALLFWLDGRPVQGKGIIEARRPFYILAQMFLAAMALQYLLGSHISVPVIYAVMDLLLWTAAGAALLLLVTPRGLALAACLLGVTAVFLHFRGDGALKLSEEDHGSRKVDVSALFDPAKGREAWVDERGFLKSPGGDFTRVDVYSAILGARVDYVEEWASEENQKLGAPMNYRFVSKKF